MPFRSYFAFLPRLALRSNFHEYRFSYSCAANVEAAINKISRDPRGLLIDDAGPLVQTQQKRPLIKRLFSFEGEEGTVARGTGATRPCVTMYLLPFCGLTGCF
jgi:hypothetical protein